MKELMEEKLGDNDVATSALFFYLVTWILILSVVVVVVVVGVIVVLVLVGI